MRKFEFGLFGLLVIVGNYYGSVFGIGIALCGFLAAVGLIEEMMNRSKNKVKNSKKEDK